MVIRLCCLVLASFLSACVEPPRSQMEFALGTVNVVNLFEKGNNQLYSRIFSRIREIDRTMGMSDNGDPSSGVAAINRQAGIAPVKVRADLIEVLETALYYSALSDGAFDPTIGPLVQLWGIGTDTPRIPREDEITAALDLVNWRDLVVDSAAGTAFLRRAGMALDLGAIAKGYAGDEAVRIAREGRAKRAVIDLGGNIVVLGWRGKQGRELLPWRIGIQNPLDDRGAYIGILAVHDTSVVTSGVYERFFELGERRYHHLLSTTDGYPVENGLLSVTIVTGRSIEADALSTVVFTLGFERGRAVIDAIPNAEAVFVFDNRSIYITSGLAGIFTLADDAFVMMPPITP